MKFNVKKCKVMHMGARNGNVKLSMPDETGMKLLEVTTNAVCKANQILGLIRRTFTYMDCQLMKQLYTALVGPHLVVRIW